MKTLTATSADPYNSWSVRYVDDTTGKHKQADFHTEAGMQRFLERKADSITVLAFADPEGN